MDESLGRGRVLRQESRLVQEGFCGNPTMNERVIQFRVGVVVVAAVTVAVFLIMIFGEGRSLLRGKYTIYLYFPQAPGVAQGTPVQKNGVNIGRISDVELDDQAGGVKLTARIDSNRKLYTNEVAVLKRSSLLGDAVLEFVPRGEVPVSRELLQDGSLLADGIVASDPMEVLANLQGTVASAVTAIESAANQVDTLAGNLNQSFGTNQDRFQRILEKSELALDQFSSTMNTLNQFVGDDGLRQDLQRSLRELPATLDQMKMTLKTADEAIRSFESVGKKAEENLDNLAGLTRPFRDQGDKLVKDIDNQLDNLDELLGQLIIFAEALNNREGTLGQLVHNRELYDRLNTAAENIEKSTRRVEPILRDVRTLTDKLARDPRQLGVKGALDRRPLGVGLSTAPTPQTEVYESVSGSRMSDGASPSF